MSEKKLDIPAVILAGGLGLRMGGIDKCMLSVGHSSVLALTTKILQAQTEQVFLNINGDETRFSENTLPIIKDEFETPIGPLGGLQSVFHYVFSAHPNAKWLLSVAGDCPFLPQDLLEKLSATIEDDTEVIYCRSHQRDHFVIALWSRDIEAKLNSYIDRGDRSVGRFIRTLTYKTVLFSDDPIDPFFNINTQEELLQAQATVDTNE